MREALERDNANTVPMIFGTSPTFDAIMEAIVTIDGVANRGERHE